MGERAKLVPYITGGTGSASESLLQPDTLPDMLHAGTINVPAVAALGKAVEFVTKKGTENILIHERRLAGEFIKRIENTEGVRVLGCSDMQRRNGTVAFIIEGTDSQEVAELLSNKYGIASRGGWHCAYRAHKTLGTQKSGAVRIGFGYYNRLTDSIKAARAVNAVAKKYSDDVY